MKYIKNRNTYRINEAWLDQKLNSIESDIIKAIVTNWAKPFSKLMESIKDKWTTIKGADISYQFLAALNKSFEFLYNETQKITDPEDIDDLIPNITSTNALLKDEFIKKLFSSLPDNPNINGYSATIKELFDKVEENIESLTEEFKNKLEEKEVVDAKIKEAVKVFKDIFKNIEEEVKNIDFEKLIEDNKDNKTLFKVGDMVKYKKEEFDEEKQASEQPDNVAEGEVKEIDGDTIKIFNKQVGKEIEKKVTDIIIQKVDKAKKVEDLKSELTKMKDDPKKLTKVLDFVKDLNK